ncbi:fungal-specific transcription factor domain-containing protein [Ephemerocybe angulata]|uniref:Fungal-specific transcription factor domain-containing protein n=1 Tax=Ephemerocybe angulata TaxID=980116 RepID=A0A8H6IHK6_9AGAR|nr:fungal-specific transcription factor domain-containing protein [Tulosesus angulatus]
MSSEEGESANAGKEPIKVKRRRLHGACDLCRQKKIRCDSAKRPGNKCSNCVAFRSECTHLHTNQKMGRGYIASREGLSFPSDALSLPELWSSMQPLLNTILTTTYQAPANPAIIRETLVNLARYARALESAVPAEALAEQQELSQDLRPSLSSVPSNEALEIGPPGPSRLSVVSGPVDSASPRELGALAENFKRSILLTSPDERFLGSSSSAAILENTIEWVAEEPPHCSSNPETCGATKHIRPEFWAVHPWDQAPPPTHTEFDFPEPDLLQDLVELYFTYLEVYGPLLHRPTFERGIKEGLHLSDRGFGGTVLAVCAVASRFSNDERVILEGTNSLHSCGLKWYRQLDVFNESSLRAPSLYEMQALCLAITYLQGTSTPEKCWYMLGFAIRAAQDIGLHRKPKSEVLPSVESELRKRVFWRLALGDSVISITIGRPPAINLIDFDADLPIECDDEYWETGDPSTDFKQPAGKPSKMAYYTSLMKLTEIYCQARRAFYSVKHPEVPPGMSEDDWDREVLAKLDSALNAWVDKVPEHLRWDRHHTDGVFLDQSAVLFTNYYATQIMLHRPFLSFTKQPSLSFTALVVCTNAARACSRVMSEQSRTGMVPMPQVQIALFISGLMLLLGIWKGRRTGYAMVDERKEAKALQSIIRVLQIYETRWHMSGRFRDLLMALTSVGGFEVHFDAEGESSAPEQSAVGAKRRRDAEGDSVKPSSSPRQHSSDVPFRLPFSVEAGQSSKTTRAPRAGGTIQVTGAQQLNSVIDPRISPPPSTLPALNDHEVDSPLISAYDLPLYTSDLSKPPFDFIMPGDPRHTYAAPTTEQLDLLGMMLGQEGDTGAGGASTSSGDDATAHMGPVPSAGLFNYEALQHMFHGYAQATSSNQTASSFGTDFSATGHASTHQGYSFLEPQECMPSHSMDITGWSHAPPRSQWNEWNEHISAIESLDGAQVHITATTGVVGLGTMPESRLGGVQPTIPMA